MRIVSVVFAALTLMVVACSSAAIESGAAKQRPDICELTFTRKQS